MASLWVGQWAPRANLLWLLPFGVALASAAGAGIIDARALAAILGLAAACAAAARAPHRTIRAIAHVLMLGIAAGLFLHVLPGFDNPLVLSNVIVSPGGEPYTKFLSFDKGAAGLLLLGVYAPGLTAADKGATRIPGFLWRFAALVIVMMGLSIAAGYVRWDPKLPSWWPMWVWSMVFLTALPEEALFRGVAQTWIAGRLGTSPRAGVYAAAIVGALFGVAHLGGGVTYVGLSAVAGFGYGWIYASSRSIGAAIAAHAGLNTLHFFLFTYPALLSNTT